MTISASDILALPDSPQKRVTTLRYRLNRAAIGKPRMTRRDKWKQRPCVMEYRRFADALRAACPDVPPAAEVEELRVYAYFAPPESWSAKKRLRMLGQRKRTKPDPDNILKAVIDPLWPDDEAIGDIGAVLRRWDVSDSVVIEIDVAAGRDGRTNP